MEISQGPGGGLEEGLQLVLHVLEVSQVPDGGLEEGLQLVLEVQRDLQLPANKHMRSTTNHHYFNFSTPRTVQFTAPKSG